MNVAAPLRLLFVALLLAFAPMPVAWAHAQLLSSTPAENALLDNAPTDVKLLFNEPVNPLATRLIGPDGVPQDLTRATVGGDELTIMLPDGIADGTQVLSWRVVSTDGHPIGGTLIFSVGHVTGAAAVDTTSDRAVSAFLWLSKALLYVCLFGGVGGALFAAITPVPAMAQRLALILSAGGLLLSPFTLGLQGLDALGLTLASFTVGKVWSTALATSYGATVLVLGTAFALASVATANGRLAFWCGLLAGLTGAMALALSGHASAAAPQWLTRPAVFLHIAGIIFWIGALAPLFLLLRHTTASADQALLRFSSVVPYAVAALVLSGATLALVQMGPPSAAWLTPYGYILAAKLILLVVLFGLAFWNRIGLTGPALRGELASRSSLRRSIAVELGLVLVILALVAGWRFTPPPRALAEVAEASVAGPLTEHLISGDTMVMLTMTPGHAGLVEIELFVGDLTHSPKEVQAVSLILAAPQLGIEPIRREAVADAGVWRISDLTIPVAATWTIEAEIRLSRFELVRPSLEIVIP